MGDIWDAARAGDLSEITRLVGQDPGLLDAAQSPFGKTPLIYASVEGHVGVVRWMVDKGGAINKRDFAGWTALSFASSNSRLAVMRLLFEKGADPTISTASDWTPLMVASDKGHLEVVRFLLGIPSVRASMNNRDDEGSTALWRACYYGKGGVARLLLKRGADPTIADDRDITPMAMAKNLTTSYAVSAEGRRECVAALEVRILVLVPIRQHPLLY
jgi:ankyrin repeat protein